jgi:hypothetical protein
MKPKHLLALGVFAGVAAASLTAAQKPAPAQPTEQQKLKERVDGLESQLKEAQAKADRASIEKDYIERVEKDTKEFYSQAFNSQMWTLGIMGIILAAVFGLTARFGLNLFDRRMQDALRDASTKLREEFTKKLTDELQDLEKSNIDQMARLEESLQKRIAQLSSDLDIRSNFQNEHAYAYSAAMGSLWPSAADGFRRALTIYKEQQARQLIPKAAAACTICQLLECISASELDKFPENAAKELATPLFSGLDPERALAATLGPKYAPFLTKSPQRPTQPTRPGTASRPAAPDKPMTK